MTAPNDALIARIALDQAGLRQQLDQAQAQFTGFGASVKSALGVVGATLAGTFTVGAFTAWIKGAVDAADETSKLAQKVGVTVQQVAGLQLAFRQSGLDTAEFESSLGKLAKSASEGNDAFAAIGVSVKAADGSLRSTREILGDTAEQFAGMEDSAAKTAIAIELFGKSGAKLIPLLNGGAEGLRQFDAMAQSLGLTLDERTAKAAENFNDTLDLIGQAGQGVARRVTAELLPTLNSLAGTLFKNVAEGDNLKRVAEAIGVAFKGLYTVVAGVVAAFQTVGTAIGGVGAAIAAIIRGDFGQVKSIISEMANDVRTTWAGTAQNVADVWSGANAKVTEGMVAVAGAAKRAAPVLKDLKESAAALAKQEDLRRKLLDEVSALERNAEGVEKLSDAQKLMLKIGEALRDGTVRLTDAEKANVFGRLEALDAAQRLAKANEALVKSLIEAGKEEEKRNDDRRKALGDVYAEIAAAQEKSAALALEAAGIKQTASAVLELRAAKLEYLADTEMEPGGSEERARLYRAEAAALRELAGVVRGNEIREQMIDQAKAAEDAWRTAADQIGQSLTDALVRGFESGKSVVKSIGEYIINFFKTTVARGIAQTISAALMSALSGTASAASTGSGVAGFLSGLGVKGGSIGGAGQFVGGAISTLTGATSLSGAFDAWLMSDLASTAGLLGAVAPYVAAAFAVYSIAKAIKDNGGSPGVQNYGIVGTMGLGYAGNVPNLQSPTAYVPIIQPIADAVAAAVSRLGGTVGNTTYGIYTSASPDGKGAYLRADVANASGLIYTADSNAANDTLQQRIAEQLPKLLLAGLQDANLDETFAEYFRALDLSSATQEQVQAAVEAAVAAREFSTALATLGGNLAQLPKVAVTAQLELMQALGGTANAMQLLAGYTQNYLTDVEREAMLRQQVAGALAQVNLELPGTREAYRALLEAQDLTTESGRAAWAVLLQNADAFAQLVPPSEAAVQAVEEVAVAMRSAADIAREREGLERRLMQLAGDTAGLRAAELADLDASNRALQERIWAIEDERAAAEAAAQAAARATQAMLDAAGISAEGMGDIIRDGLLGRASREDVGGKLGELILGGIRRALADQATQSISTAFVDAIVKPMLQAVLTGGNIAAAVSQQSIDAVVAQAQRAAEAYAAVLSDPAFIDAMARIGSAVDSIVASTTTLTTTAAQLGQTVSSFQLVNPVADWSGLSPLQQAEIRVDQFRFQLRSEERRRFALDPAAEDYEAALAGVNERIGTLTAGLTEAEAALAALSTAVDDTTTAARSAEQIAAERYRLETRALQLQGDTAALRARELAALDESNRALQQQIWTMEDMAAAAEAAARVQAEADAQAQRVASERLGLEQRLLQVQGDTAALRAMELAGLDESNRALQERIYALQDEAQAAAEAAAQAQRAASEREALQRRVWELEGNTAALRAAELAVLDPANRALQERIWALEAEAQAAAEASAAEARIASERAGLQQQLLELQGDTAALRALQLAALDESNQALQQQIWALQDAASAAAEAAAAESALAAARDRIASERAGLEEQLMRLEGRTTELRALQLARLDPSNRALQEQVWALEDQAAAADAAARAAQEAADAERRLAEERDREARRIADERYGLETRLLQLQGDTDELRRRELAALDESNRALLEQIFALEDQAAAAEKAARAADELRQNWQGASDAIVSEVNRISGLMQTGSGSFASAQRDFALATAAARAGDLEAARRLPELSRDLLALAERQVSSMTDLRRIQALTSASLGETNRLIGDAHLAPPAPPEVVDGLDRLHRDNGEQTTQLAAMRKSMDDLYKLMRRVTRDGDSLVTTEA